MDGTKVTVKEYLTHWLTADKKEIRGSTWERHERDIRLHLLPDLGAIRLAALTPLRVQAHIEQKLRILSAGSVRRLVAVLRCALNHAVALGMIARNPCPGVKLPRPSEQEMHVWGEDQVRQFLVATQDDPDAALWRLAVMVGIRKGELLALRWDDVDLSRATITIQRTLTRDKERRSIVGQPKTKAGRRTLTIPAICVAALKAHRQEQRVQQMAHRDRWQDNNLVFPAHEGGYMRENIPNRRSGVIQSDGESADNPLPRSATHSGNAHARARVSPRVVQERLGHASLAMTLGLYSHVTLTMQEEAATRMDRMFGA